MLATFTDSKTTKALPLHLKPSKPGKNDIAGSERGKLCKKKKKACAVLTCKIHVNISVGNLMSVFDRG